MASQEMVPLSSKSPSSNSPLLVECGPEAKRPREDQYIAAPALNITRSRRRSFTLGFKFLSPWFGEPMSPTSTASPPTSPTAAARNADIAHMYTSAGTIHLNKIKASRMTIAKNVDWHSRVMDLFHVLVRTPLTFLVLFMFLLALVVSLIFAAIFYTNHDDPNTVVNARGFSDYYVFAIQTYTTVGFGYLFPNNGFAHFWSSALLMVSVVCNAAFTGLIFARFSRPVSLINFSKSCLITTLNHRRVFMFRLANGRSNNRMIDAHLAVSLASDEPNEDGVMLRKYYELPLQRDHQPLFSLMWLAVHEIDTDDASGEAESSVLLDCSPQNSAHYFRNIIVTFQAYDTDSNQTVFAKYVNTVVVIVLELALRASSVMLSPVTDCVKYSCILNSATRTFPITYSGTCSLNR